MSTEKTPKKTLVLHVTVPGYWADDLDDMAREYAEDRDNPTDRDRLDVVTDEWMSNQVIVTLLSLEETEMHAYTGRIVGAEVRDRDSRDG